MKTPRHPKAVILAWIEGIADKINDWLYDLASRWECHPCIRCGKWTLSFYQVCEDCDPITDSREQRDAISGVLATRLPEAHVYLNGEMIIASIHDGQPITIASNWDAKGWPKEGFVLFSSNGGPAFEGTWEQIVDRAEFILRKELEEVMEDLSREDFAFIERDDS